MYYDPDLDEFILEDESAKGELLPVSIIDIVRNGDLIVIKLSDETERAFELPLPKDGNDGKNGIDGRDGADGKDGNDGKNGIDGRDGADGKDGNDGNDGVGIADIEKRNNDLIVTLTNGETKTIPLPKAKIFSAGGRDDIRDIRGLQEALDSKLQSGDNISELLNDAGYLTSYTETDTLQSVTDRGATTTNTVTLSPSGNNKAIIVNGSGSGDAIDITHAGSGAKLKIGTTGSGDLIDAGDFNVDRHGNVAASKFATSGGDDTELVAGDGTLIPISSISSSSSGADTFSYTYYGGF
jgi:hypothetical protein